MHSIHTLIVDLTLITIYAGLTTLFCKKFKQPIVLGYVLAGILAGPHFNFLPTVSDKENLTLWGEIGVIFLLFGLGLEFSFKKMMNVGKSAMITANSNVLFMLFIGYSTGLLLGWSTMDSFFLGSMISMSSTTIIIKAFDDLNIKKQKFTDLVFGVLVVEDLVGILMLVMLPMVAVGSSIDGGQLLISAAKLFFFLILCFIIGIYLVPTFLNKISKYLNDEMLLLITVSMCFGMVLLATGFGFSSALGAFLMGSILSETEVIDKIEKNIKPLKDFFGAVFFVSVGMMVNPILFIEYAKPILVITAIVMIGNTTLSCLGFIVSGQPLKTAISGGFSLAQVGEFAFIIASLGMSLDVLDAKVYPIIVAVCVITTFFTPMMIKAADPFYKKLMGIMPVKLAEYFNKTEKAPSATPSEEKMWGELFKNYFLRLILFSMILYFIIIISGSYIQPFMHTLFPGLWGRITTTTITLVLMAPFLKALIGWEAILPSFIIGTIRYLFFWKKPKVTEAAEGEGENKEGVVKKLEDKFDFFSGWSENVENVRNFFVSNSVLAKIYYKLWMAKKSNRLPLAVMTSLRLLLICFFIVTVVHHFLTENVEVIILMLCGTVLVLFQSRWLLTQYMKMEAQFLANLRGRKTEQEEEKQVPETEKK